MERLDGTNSYRGVSSSGHPRILYLAHARLWYAVSAKGNDLPKLTNILRDAALIPSAAELILNKRGRWVSLVGATQLCPVGQKMSRPGLSEGGIQTRGGENASLQHCSRFQGPQELRNGAEKRQLCRICLLFLFRVKNSFLTSAVSWGNRSRWWMLVLSFACERLSTQGDVMWESLRLRDEHKVVLLKWLDVNLIYPFSVLMTQTYKDVLVCVCVCYIVYLWFSLGLFAPQCLWREMTVSRN